MQKYPNGTPKVPKGTQKGPQRYPKGTPKVPQRYPKGSSKGTLKITTKDTNIYPISMDCFLLINPS